MSCVANKPEAVKIIRRWILTSVLALLTQLPALAVQNVAISWNPSGDTTVAGYKIYYGGASGNYTSVVDAGNATSLTISGLADGSTNYFSATTYDTSADESPFSDEVVFVAPLAATNQVVTVPAGPAPTNPPATNSSPVLQVVSNLMLATNPADIHSVVLSWNASTDAGVVGYQILIGQASGNYSLSENVGLVSSLVITGLVSGTTNYFAVREFNAAWNESDMSSEVHWLVPMPADPGSTNSISQNTAVASPPPVLNAVSGLFFTTNAANINMVTLGWTPSIDAGVTGYQVFSGKKSGSYSLTQNVAVVSSLVFTGLVSGTTNFFAVRERVTATNLGPVSVAASWVVPVKPNLPPTLNALTNLILNVNVQQTVKLSGITSGSTNEHQTLKITATSSDTTLIPTPKVTYTSPNSTGSLVFKPAYNKTGTVTITVTVDDGATNTPTHLFTRSFTVTVVNQALLAAMPKFSKQLTGTRVLTNKPVVLSVTMSGQSPFKYQWKFNGTNLAGQTAATLSITSAKPANSGAYMVQVSNSAGLTNSAVAMLTVITNTAATIAMPAVATPGQFAFQIPGEATLKYVIEATSDFQNWTPVQTNTAPFTFTQTNASSYDQRYYRARYLP
ncbi:MAG TPA: immunoglobulin domain-containing protein [Candidatus Acidoferrales bacterium]|jgi:hypothetical protein|nr:immunoglobulin domain-containing protein [Candidatus Acidoferrales bacterium]